VNPTIVGFIVFACTFAGMLLGMWLRTTLPARQLDAESTDTVKVAIGLIATITALVLGLVTASAKSSFDAVDTGVKQAALQILALDRALARYGPETGEIREGLQRILGVRMDMIWPPGASKLASPEPMRPGSASGPERIADAIRDLQPRDDRQRALQSRAADLAEGLLQVRWLVVAGTGTSVPLTFLVILLFWLTITFGSFGLFAPRNTLAVTALLVCALSVGSAVFLVLEMDGPFDGVIQVSPDPLRTAHAHLNR
jgi:hypothetical protein